MQEDKSIAKRCRLCQRFYYPIRKDQKYCPNCRSKKSYYKKVKKHRRQCKKCGKKFVAKRKDQIFCSSDCRNSYHYVYIEKTKVCPWCKKEFSTSNKRKYCSHSCYLAAKLKRDHIYYMGTKHTGENK